VPINIIQESAEALPIPPPEVEQLKEQVLQLSNKINDLTEDYDYPIVDIVLAQTMAQAIKPYVDRLVAVNLLLNPVDRIVSKRDQIQELQLQIAEEMAVVEDLTEDIGEEVDHSILNDLQSKIASVKKDRKLFVSKVDAEDAAPEAKSNNKKKTQRIVDLPLEARFERIFGDRFVAPARLEALLGVRFSPEFNATVQESLNKAWDWLYHREELQTHFENNRIKTLQNTFTDYALLLRSPYIGNKDGVQVQCSLSTLRDRFNTFFVGGSDRGLWYANMPFYKQPIKKGHWTLLDRQYLNCTFKKPSIRLLMYARSNGLSAKMVRQKSVTEDIYDRILLELALQERFVDNCHSITGTTYQPNAKATTKQVYTYYNDDALRISGKSGIPHWRPSKPRWPGVLPSILFPV
jgi:hypothetical protein